jgi:hypothetical protein
MKEVKMLNKLKSLFSKKPKKEVTEQPKPAKKKVLSPKEEATAKGEPYIGILTVEVDETNINNGSFELDWNDKFVVNLIRAGYKQRNDDSDTVIVERWFQTVCRNIALEVYEQQQADPSNRETTRYDLNKRDIGNNRTEVS